MVLNYLIIKNKIYFFNIMGTIAEQLPHIDISQNNEFTPPSDYEQLFAISKFKYDELSTEQSMRVGAHELANFIPDDCGQLKARDVQTSQPGINFNAGHEGGKNGCLIDANSYLKFEELTNKNIINQLTQRLTLTTPYIRGLYDVDVESVLVPGEKSDIKRPCNVLTGKSLLTHYYTPMIKKLRDNIQNTDHIIPEDSEQTWVRGGLPSRQIMRNIDYSKRCNTENN
jgi:hypothetical protein